MRHLRLLHLLGGACLLALVYTLLPAPAVAASPNVVISQLYGGGGNAGSTYKNDYIELFNRGDAPVDLSAWSVQYASSAGTSWAVSNLSGTLQPGHYYLVQESAGAGGTTSLPTPDASGNIAMSASSGKVALVSSQTALSGACPTGVVDFVGFGSSANCFEGTGPTPTLSNTTAAIRADVCADADKNSTDFQALAPVPHNSTSTKACSVSTNPTGVAVANPASVDAGATTLLTVTVTPGANPPSTGLIVTGDLSAIGGSPTQAFFNDGTHGDVTADNAVFSFLATVPSGTAIGPKTLVIKVEDASLRSSTQNLVVTVTLPPEHHAIHEIQGSGNVSPLVGTRVATDGIVTAVASNGFYLEAPDAAQDADPSTSEGIFVFTSSRPSATVGDQLNVTGTVQEFQPSGSALTVTELAGAPSYSVLSAGNPLPTVIAIAPAPGSAFDALERYEGMLVRIDSPRATGPTGGSTASDGIFYVTSSTVPRPFREPGLEPGIAYPAGMPDGAPRFDGNAERVRVDAAACSPRPVVAANDLLPALSGPLSYSTDYTLVATCPLSFTTTATASPLSARGDREFTVASFNMLNFTNDTNRLGKASKAIRLVMREPDVIGVEEMNNLTTLQALAARVNSEAGDTPNYQAALLATSGSQNVGFLYRGDRLSDVNVVEVGADLLMPDGKNVLNDRPPLVMTAKLIPPAGQKFPVTIIVNHLRSLIDVDTVSSTGDFARTKRLLGAEYLASLIAQHQAAGEHVIAVGDFNAYEFNDGYVDVLHTVTGSPTPADQVLLASVFNYDPDAVDLITTLAPEARYSYVENGNAQDIDHIVATGDLLTRPYRLEVAHNDADFPVSFGSDFTRSERVSDHDMPVAYFTFPQADLATTITAAASSVLSGKTQQYTITVANSGSDAAQNLTFTDVLPPQSTFQSISAPLGWSCTDPGAGHTGNVVCTSNSLAAGASAQFLLNVVVGCLTADGATINNVAGVITDTFDTNHANDNASLLSSVENPPPSIADLAVDKPVLSPADHKFVDILLTYSLSDNCDASIPAAVTVTSDQPVDGKGDGHTSSDWNVIDAHHLKLRAERAPDEVQGRIYTITVKATDSFGYFTTGTVDVVVPRADNPQQP